ILTSPGCASFSNPIDTRFSQYGEIYRKEVDDMRLVGRDFESAKLALVAAGFEPQGQPLSDGRCIFMLKEDVDVWASAKWYITIRPKDCKVASVETKIENGGK
ncbi:MAG TPA: hypothetical protein VGE52_16120, partial [Pirellulales bacterium]